MNDQPLVSVCTTFKTAERYIYRVLESVLRQTYANVELVVVDNVSEDGSADVVKRYAAKDSRVVYVRNETDIGFPESLKKSFELARGKFVMMIGADDWLAKDYIEEGVKAFEAFPDAAGIIPRLITLREGQPDHFTLESETFAEFTPPRAYPAGWFAERMYRPTHLYISALALIRKEDAVASFRYFLAHHRDNASPLISAELRDMFRRGFGIDAIMFLEILTRHKRFVFASSLHHMKTTGGQTIHFDLGQESLAKVVAHYWSYLFTFMVMYKSKWPAYYRGVKIFFGAEVLSSIALRLLRRGPRTFFADWNRAKGEIVIFFSDFSSFELAGAALGALGRMVRRAAAYGARKIRGKAAKTESGKKYFNGEHFLDASGTFVAR
jgi:glycosyltransferase involved in cell wall biosynthesis